MGCPSTRPCVCWRVPRLTTPCLSDPDWSEIVAGDWLADMLQGLRSPEGLAAVTPGPALKASLRAYQQAGRALVAPA